MICPSCGCKSRVVNTVNDPIVNETHRQRKCLGCGTVFYTTESVSSMSLSFRRSWNRGLKIKRKKVKAERRN